MSTESNINIIITAMGDFAEQLRKHNESMNKFADDIKKVNEKMQKDEKSMLDKRLMSFSTFSKNLSRLGGQMILAGGAITAPLLGAFAKFTEYSVPAREASRQLSESLLAITNALGQAVLPMFEKLAQFVTNIANAFQNLDKDLLNDVVKWALVSAAVLLVVGSVVKLIGTLGNLVTTIIRVGKAISVFMLANPWILAITITVIALVAAVYLLAKNWETVGTTVMQVVSFIQKTLTTIGNVAQIAAKSVALVFVKAVDAVLEAIETPLNSISTLINKIADLVSKFSTTLGNALRAAAEPFSYVQEKIHGMRDSLAETRKDLQTGIKQDITDISDTWKQGVTSWASSLDIGMGKIKEFLNYMDSLTKGKGGLANPITGDFIEGFKYGLNEMKTELNNFYEFGKQMAKEMSNAMKDTFSDVFFSAFNGDLEGVLEAFKGFKDKMFRMLSDYLAQTLMAKMLNSTKEKAMATTEVAQNAAVAGSGAAANQAKINPWVALATGAAIMAAVMAFAGKFAQGGIVPGTNYSGDRMLAAVNSGEAIFNQRQKDNLLMAIANGAATGGSGGIKVNIINNNNAQVSAKENTNSNGERTLDIIIESKVGSFLSGQKGANLMATVYGVNKQGLRV